MNRINVDKTVLKVLKYNKKNGWKYTIIYKLFKNTNKQITWKIYKIFIHHILVNYILLLIYLINIKTYINYWVKNKISIQLYSCKNNNKLNEV